MTRYYIGINNQRTGPFPLDQLIANGLTPDALVWCSGMPGWQKASQVPEVAALFTQQPQPQPGYGWAPPAQGYQQPQYQQPQYQQPQYNYGFDYKQQMSDQHLATYGYRPQMEFGEAIKVCFNKFVDFKGRARRSEYWWFYLFSQLVAMFTCGLGSLVCLLPMLAVTVRRLHDTGRSAWWAFLPYVFVIAMYVTIIPLAIADDNYKALTGTSLVIYIVSLVACIAIGIALLVFCCTDGDRAPNRYGPSPKYE